MTHLKQLVTFFQLKQSFVLSQNFELQISCSTMLFALSRVTLVTIWLVYSNAETAVCLLADIILSPLRNIVK